MLMKREDKSIRIMVCKDMKRLSKIRSSNHAYRKGLTNTTCKYHFGIGDWIDLVGRDAARTVNQIID